MMLSSFEWLLLTKNQSRGHLRGASTEILWLRAASENIIPPHSQNYLLPDKFGYGELERLSLLFWLMCDRELRWG